MQMTRRAFSRGMGSLFGGAAVPNGAGGKVVAAVLPAEPGVDDAYGKLLSEFIRVEEAAIAAGRHSATQAGAATWEGRQLEGFIAELDGRVDIKMTARQIYAEFKERFRAAAQRVREKLAEDARHEKPQIAADPDWSAAGDCPSDRGADIATFEAGDVELASNSGHADGPETDAAAARLS